MYNIIMNPSYFFPHSVHDQVRSECLTCTFRASCCSARLSRARVPSPVPLPGTGDHGHKSKKDVAAIFHICVVFTDESK